MALLARIPPGRAGRMWLRRRLATAERGREQLDRKLRILLPDLQRLLRAVLFPEAVPAARRLRLAGMRPISNIVDASPVVSAAAANSSPVPAMPATTKPLRTKVGDWPEPMSASDAQPLMTAATAWRA